MGGFVHVQVSYFMAFNRILGFRRYELAEYVGC